MVSPDFVILATLLASDLDTLCLQADYVYSKLAVGYLLLLLIILLVFS